MNSSRLRIFPWVTLFAGIIGLALRCWLFSGVDRKGLIPQNHIAEMLCFILLAVILGVCLPAMKHISSATAGNSNFAVAGSIVGAAAMVFSGCFLTEKALFPLLLCAFSVVIGIALLFDACGHIKGKPANPWIHYICMSFMVLRIMFSCRGWSGETQVQRFVFELLAALFFLLALYYRAQIFIGGTGRKQYLLFTQAALYCFCLCLANTDFLFSLGAAVWLTAETLRVPDPQGE